MEISRPDSQGSKACNCAIGKNSHTQMKPHTAWCVVKLNNNVKMRHTIGKNSFDETR